MSVWNYIFPFLFTVSLLSLNDISSDNCKPPSRQFLHYKLHSKSSVVEQTRHSEPRASPPHLLPLISGLLHVLVWVTTKTKAGLRLDGEHSWRLGLLVFLWCVWLTEINCPTSWTCLCSQLKCSFTPLPTFLSCLVLYPAVPFDINTSQRRMAKNSLEWTWDQLLHNRMEGGAA